ncbi:MAG: FAD binding domain-containing protein [Acidobacteria bacterium]|nr:FAD binding domain-containing protein [Acidobacteriota bacterium]
MRPRTLEHAAEFLAQHALTAAGDEAPPRPARRSGGVEIIAGGTDLIPSLRQRLFEPEYVLDLRSVPGLRGIRELSGGDIEIGGLTTLREIERSSIVCQRYPVLSEAVKTVASPVIRNMATIGGNICLDTRCVWYNQSQQWRRSCGFCIKKDGDLCHVAPGGQKCWAAFSADTPPALLCLGAEIEIASAGAIRRVPLESFYTGEGEARMRLGRNEILTRVILPGATAGCRGAYRKLRIRGSIDYPLAGVAVALRGNDGMPEARIAITGVNPAPVLVKKAGALLAHGALSGDLVSAAADLAAAAAKPLTTSALTPEYRREMVRVFTRRALMELAGAPY